MAFCGNCGTQLQDGVKFCTECGKEVGTAGAAKAADAGNTDNLANLYQLARRARRNNEFDRAAQYYDQIVVEMPEDWESVFFSTLYAAMRSYRNEQAGTALMSLHNCIETVYSLINKYVDQDEQEEIASLVYDELTAACDGIHKDTEENFEALFQRLRKVSEYTDEMRRIEKDNYQQRAARNVAISKIYYALGERLLLQFGEHCNIGQNAVRTIRDGIRLVEYHTVNALTNREKKEIVNRYNSDLEALLRVLAKQRFEDYWAAHQAEKAELESEKKPLLEQISVLEDEIAAIPQRTEGYSHMVMLQAKVNDLTAEKKALGLLSVFLKTKERKAIQSQIDSVNAEIAPIQARINAAIYAVKQRIAPLQERVDEIDNELTKPR